MPSIPELQIPKEELYQIITSYKRKKEIDILEDDDADLALMDALYSLSAPDRYIFCLYAEFQSLRKVAAALGISYGSTKKIINDIKQQIKDALPKDFNKL